MPYRKTPIFTEGYYHIYNRGVEKRSIVLDRADRQRWSRKLREYKEKSGIVLLCYCLMPNHFHLLVKQNIDDSIVKFMRMFSTSHSMYFNKRYERVGPLFQGRFKAKLIDQEGYLLQLSRYIHLNPVELLIRDASFQKARLLHSLIESFLRGYKWSSYLEYLEDSKEGLCELEIAEYFSQINPRLGYQSFVMGGVDDFIHGKLLEGEF